MGDIQRRERDSEKRETERGCKQKNGEKKIIIKIVVVFFLGIVFFTDPISLVCVFSLFVFGPRKRMRARVLIQIS